MSKENKEEVKPEEKKKDDGKGLLPPDELVSTYTNNPSRRRYNDY